MYMWRHSAHAPHIPSPLILSIELRLPGTDNTPPLMPSSGVHAYSAPILTAHIPDAHVLMGRDRQGSLHNILPFLDRLTCVIPSATRSFSFSETPCPAPHPPLPNFSFTKDAIEIPLLMIPKPQSIDFS